MRTDASLRLVLLGHLLRKHALLWAGCPCSGVNASRVTAPQMPCGAGYDWLTALPSGDSVLSEKNLFLSAMIQSRAENREIWVH